MPSKVRLKNLRNVNKGYLNILTLFRISFSTCVSYSRIQNNFYFMAEAEKYFYVTEVEVNLNSRSRDCIFLLRYKSGKFIQDIYTGFYIRPLCTPNKFIPPQVLTCQIFSKLGIVNHQENSIKIIPLKIILACPQIQNETLLLAPLQQCSCTCSRCSLRYIHPIPREAVRRTKTQIHKSVKMTKWLWGNVE